MTNNGDTQVDYDVDGKKKRKTGKTTKYTSMTLVHIYRYAKEGMLENSIVQLLGISRMTFLAWKKKYPEIIDVLKLAKQDGTEKNFAKYCYEKLPKELQLLWDKIRSWELEPGGVNKIELMLRDHGTSVRQAMYLQSLISSNFSPSRAGIKVGVNKKMLESWIAEDPDFAELVEQITWHKGNFFDEKLVKLVDEGNVAATIFANKTWNKDRGYGNSLNISGSVNVTGNILHGVLDLGELLPYLSSSAKAEVLEAIRRKETAEKKVELLPEEVLVKQLVAMPEVVDVVSSVG